MGEERKENRPLVVFAEDFSSAVEQNKFINRVCEASRDGRPQQVIFAALKGETLDIPEHASGLAIRKHLKAEFRKVSKVSGGKSEKVAKLGM